MASLLHTLNLFNVNNSDGAIKFYEYDTSGNLSETSKIDFKNTGDITLDASGDIILDAANSNIMFKDAETQFLKFTNSSGDCTITNGDADKDIIFKDAGGSTIFTIDGSSESILMDTNKKIEFRNSNIHISSDADGYLSAQANTGVNININGSDELAITSTTATFGTNIVIPNAATIGSVGDTDAVSISAGGVVNISATTASSSTTTGALTVAGGAAVAADLHVGDDLMLKSDSAVLNFGASNDVSLTHVSGSGLKLNTSKKIMFGEDGEYISGDNTDLTIASGRHIVFSSTSNVGIGTTAPIGKLQVGNAVPTNSSSANYGSSSNEFGGWGTSEISKGLLVVNETLVDDDSVGTSKPVLTLFRPGKNSHAYGSGATFDIARHSTHGSDYSQSRLDISLIKNTATQKETVMTMLDTGNVGIGVSDPDYKLEILSTSTQQKWSYDGTSYATMTINSDSDAILDTAETGNIALHARGKVYIDSYEGDIYFQNNGNHRIHWNNSSGDWTMENKTQDKDTIFKVNYGGISTEVMRLDGSASSLLIASGNKIQFRDTNIHISSNADGTLTAQANHQVNININGTNELEITPSTAKFGTNIHLSSEITTVSAPSDNNGGILYTKADGKIYWISHDVSETDLTSGGGDKISENNTEVETVDSGTNGHIIFKTEGNEIMRYTADGNSLYEKSGTITITSGGGTSNNGSITYEFKTDGDIYYKIFAGSTNYSTTFDPNEVGGSITNVSEGVDLLNKDYLKNAPADLSKEFYLVNGANYTEGTINWTNPGSNLQSYSIDDQAINLWNIYNANKVALQIKEYLTALREVYSSRITFNSANLDSNSNIRLNATKDVYSSNLLIKGNINKKLSNTASGSSESNVITCTNHGLVVGDVISIPSGSSEVLIVASVTNPNQFTVNKNLSSDISSGVSIYKDNDVLNIKNGNNEQKLLLNARGNLILGDYSNNNLIFDSEKFANFTTSYNGSSTLYAVPNTSGITIGEVFTMYLKYTIASDSGNYAGLIYSDDDYKIGIQLDYVAKRFVPFWDSVSGHSVTFTDYYTAFSSSIPANQNKGSTYEVIVEWDRSTNGQVTITIYFKGESSSYSWTITNSSYSQWVSSGNNSMTLASGKSLVIGAQQTIPNPSNYFKGSVEKLAIYQRQLSSEEREFLFNKDSDLKLCVLDKSYFSNNVGIGATTDSSSVSTGGLTVAGGLGVAKMVTGGSFTDGVATLTKGSLTGLVYAQSNTITDGTAIMHSGSLTSLVYARSNTITDGTSLMVSGSITNVAAMGIGVSDPDAKLEVLSTSTQQKWSYDAVSYATMTINSDSDAILQTAETGNIALQAKGTLYFEADEGNIYFQDDDTHRIHWYNSGGDWAMINQTQDKDIIFKVNDGGSTTEVMRLDGSTSNVGINNSAPNMTLEIGNITGIHNGYGLGVKSPGQYGIIIEPNSVANFNVLTAGYHNGSSWVDKVSISNTDITINDINFIVNSSGNVGIGNLNPNLKLEVLSTSTPQQKWSYDSSNYATMAVASNGASTIANSGGDFTIDSAGDIVLDAAGSDVIFKKSGTDYIKVTEVIDNSLSHVQLYATAQLRMSSNDSWQTYTFTGAQGGGQLNIYTRSNGSGNNINFVATQDNSDMMFNYGHLYITKSTGNIGIGTTSPGNHRLYVKHSQNEDGGGIYVDDFGNGKGWGIILNDNTSGNNSATFISFRLSGTEIGNINHNGTTGFVALSNFTGQHRSMYKDETINNIKNMEGLIVSANKNSYTSMSGSLTKGLSAITINESLPDISLCTKEKDKSVFGVISTTEDPDKREESYGMYNTIFEKEVGDTRPYINSLGEGAIWVSNKNNNLESGDYITSSSIPGYGMKQDDDLLHNYTVAKITMDCNFAPQTVPKKIILKDSNGDNILDSNGYVQFVDHASETELQYNIRYLQSDGTIITESDYNTKLGNGESVYKAAFVGCTYHCG